MKELLISVIMSTYNETPEELNASILSILKQTHKNLEIIIVNDNPQDLERQKYLSSLRDNRIQILCNPKNLGLVKSLNNALLHTSGNYIARMDADDISMDTRLEDELRYLTENNLDMVGSYIELMNPSKTILKAPIAEAKIKKFIKYGSCLAHPTWLVKREVYMELNGYREAYPCEDYDFLLRALKKGYHLGNIPKVELKYRLRGNSISNINNIQQYLLRIFLAQNRKHIDLLSETDIQEFFSSKSFRWKKHRLLAYRKSKAMLKDSNITKKMFVFPKVIFNEYFWKNMEENAALILRTKE